MGGNDRFGGGGGRSGFGGGGGGGWSGPPGSEKHKQISMKLYAMQITALFGIFLLLPALNMFLFPAGGSGGGSTGADSWW